MTGDGIWTILLSGIVGILLGGLVQAAVARYAAFKEGSGIAAAIRGEIEATLNSWNSSSWEKHIKSNIKRLEDARYQPTPNDVFAFPPSSRPFPVFESVLHEVGLLGTLSAQVVTVYGLARVFLLNVGLLWDLRERLLARKVTIGREALLEATLGVSGMLQEFRAVAGQVIAALAARERQRRLRVF